ncbi:hypothetical protein MJG53_010076 [Ovis ammon polii x Ovis aries]|uniref:Inhibitor of growth protein n=7 Tax=Bovidae TaxID=9895 RepID=A0A836CYW3_SHEEP|nr:hypothetical protein JEQ12_002326 [Ovis aries]KAI4581633.1 hypothetical protein MJG53_010076 [Ovis ammon polii x Ovis aries]
MLSPANGEQIHLVNYVEDYLDSIESLPFDLQRNVSLMREIDAKYQEILKELDEYYERFKREADGAQKRRALHCIQRALIRSQELGDEKIQLVSQMVELVENRARQVDSHVELLEAHQEAADATGHSKAGQDKSKNEAIAQAEKPNNKRSRRQRNNENRENAANNHDHDDVTSGTPKEKKAKASKKKKRSKAKAEREASPADLPIDPNEPTYCLCNQVSYGEMIGCDNDECPIEWFHFSCVGLSHKPKGKWYCPKCRGESEKTMDKALEKSKRERAYNRVVGLDVHSKKDDSVCGNGPEQKSASASASGRFPALVGGVNRNKTELKDYKKSIFRKAAANIILNEETPMAREARLCNITSDVSIKAAKQENGG